MLDSIPETMSEELEETADSYSEVADDILVDLYDFQRGQGKYDTSVFNTQEEYMAHVSAWWQDLSDRLEAYVLRRDNRLN